MKTYSELIKIDDYLERYYYLRTHAMVGVETFGHNRYLNQIVYGSIMWKSIRDKAIIRDGGCDMGLEDYPIAEGIKIVVHHIVPITAEDVINGDPKIFDLDNLISVSENTHKAIHYGDESLLITKPITRMPGDMCPWRS